MQISLSGSVSAPGDKSISHRALILGALAEGTTKITGLLEGDDILHTANAMRSFGVRVTRQGAVEGAGAGAWQVEGCGARGFSAPDAPINFGNAGTGARLILGAAAGFNLDVSYCGDESLSSRPMSRVLTPLREMGAIFMARGDKLPLSQKPSAVPEGKNALSPISFTPPHASAQVKSCILLAGLQACGTTIVHEKRLTRDHTENMLEAFGVQVNRETIGSGQKVSINGPAHLCSTTINVPGDPSSAAFLIAGALIVPGSDITVKNVMMNPTRTGLFNVLTQMGAYLRADNVRRSGGETIADFHVKHSNLFGVIVPPERAASMIDEYPILAVISAFAKGKTVMKGLDELRVKESDRLFGTYQLLTDNGVDAQIDGDDLIVRGGIVAGGGVVKTHHDHRIAMSALILGLGAQQKISIDDESMIATSFPNFFDLMASLGANIERL
ncbi:MAG: 3-phosphoshikimate 1-carboxyvinyltransferase [Robiginitomaculum sp.]